METWIEHYGYLAVLVGTFLEGETILILAGFAAHRGYLELPWIIAAAFVGTLFGDQLFFFLGRRHSDFLLKRKPHWKPRMERVQNLINNYKILIIISFRFLYGLRTVTPFALGMSQVPLRLFITLNVLGALVWAVVIGVAGYLFGQALESFLGDLKHYEYRVLLGLAGVGLIVWLIHFWRSRKM
ncbi:MAG: DedA family protein [Deltaproteobacteria bacterium]|jgi:membrane protein DedA with SNARE-associated domain|nr:DedA family protein [Deltaproteobacteria bacterium]MCW9049025.1 DedA family protein [Deltaproteobacteria bacterium]MEE4252471.1 DedA family protein [Desulfuromusa sp.]